MKYHAEITECKTLEETTKAIYKAAGSLRVVACLAGGEAGVDCADAVSERMNLRTNGTNIANRRDKKVQQELIRDAGMRSVRQAAGKKWDDVVEFLNTEVSYGGHLHAAFCVFMLGIFLIVISCSFVHTNSNIPLC